MFIRSSVGNRREAQYNLAFLKFFPLVIDLSRVPRLSDVLERSCSGSLSRHQRSFSFVFPPFPSLCTFLLSAASNSYVHRTAVV